METTTSADGTRIAYERAGSGPAIVFVPGVFNDHTRCALLAGELEPDHTVITYDRRGRGQSTDTAPYAIEREVDDLAALIAVAGGQATVFGYSSGAILALKAAADGTPISHLALFEPPFAFDGGRAADLPARLADLVAQGRPGDAVALFQTEQIGLPAEMVAQIRESPMWPALEGMAQSMLYDATITNELAVPTPAMTAVAAPTLILSGAETWPALAAAADGLAAAMPDATRMTVEGGRDHDIPPAETAAILRRFLAAQKAEG
jgi:pimeloyl-ACP methyl ester carboxylesterase